MYLKVKILIICFIRTVLFLGFSFSFFFNESRFVKSWLLHNMPTLLTENTETKELIFTVNQ